MQYCGGIDLGGTKIEARLFDENLTEIARHRVDTPTGNYQTLLDGIVSQLKWIDEKAHDCPIGLASAGLIEAESGKIFAANLPFDKQHLERDIAQKFGRSVSLINDSNAFALSESKLGAAAKLENVIGLIIGTGVSAGQVIAGKVMNGSKGQWGEIGHIPMSAPLITKHNLPILDCGCGQAGCFETLLSGPGLEKLAEFLTGNQVSTREIMSETQFSKVLDAWFDILSELVALVLKTNDPDIIVLGGGLGALENIPERLSEELRTKMLPGLQPPKIVSAQEGDASGARGAAIYALSKSA